MSRSSTQTTTRNHVAACLYWAPLNFAVPDQRMYGILWWISGNVGRRKWEGGGGSIHRQPSRTRNFVKEGVITGKTFVRMTRDLYRTVIWGRCYFPRHTHSSSTLSSFGHHELKNAWYRRMIAWRGNRCRIIRATQNLRWKLMWCRLP